MGRYSLTLPDSKILELLKDSKKTLITGCAECANSSLAYTNDLPIYDIVKDAESGKRLRKPRAIINEADRIKKLLETNNIKSEIDIKNAWCE